VTGWRVPAGDANALAAAMHSAATLCKERAIRMGENCVVRARRCDASIGARVFARAVGLVLRSAASTARTK
jgi:hypothetical protein